MEEAPPTCATSAQSAPNYRSPTTLITNVTLNKKFPNTVFTFRINGIGKKLRVLILAPKSQFLAGFLLKK